MRSIPILLLLLLLSLPARAATRTVVTDSTTVLTNNTLIYGVGATKVQPTAVQQSGLTNLLIPGYITLGGTTNQISDNGTSLTRNGTSIGGGGAALWDGTGGLLTPDPAVDVVALTSQSDDAATNVVLILDTDVTWTADDEEKLLLYRHNGTNVAYVTQWGSNEIGKDVSPWAPDFSDVLVGIHSTSLGESDGSYLQIWAIDDPSAITRSARLRYGGFSTTGGVSSELVVDATDGANGSSITLRSEPTDGEITFEVGGTTQFQVLNLSGYTGTGLLFLSDDGTYKAAGGGDTIWVNTSGIVEPAGGQTATNRLSFTSGAADNATNVALVVDTATAWTNTTATLGHFSSGATTVDLRASGYIEIISGSSSAYSGVNIFNTNGGPTDLTTSMIDSSSSTNRNVAFNSSLSSTAFYMDYTDDGYGTFNDLQVNFMNDSVVVQIDNENGELTRLEPSIDSTGSAIAYIFDTSNVLTNGDKLLSVANATVERFAVPASGAITGRLPVDIGGACSDETTALVAGTGKLTFRAPHAMTVTAVRASLTTAQTSGGLVTVDINDSGASILSTKITLDNGERTSTTAATPPVLSDTAIVDDAEITVDLDSIGDGTAKGLKIWIIGYR